MQELLCVKAWILSGLMATAIAASAAPQEVGKGILLLGQIEHPALRECSGVVPCRHSTNIFWMHSDGRRPILYAVTSQGRSVAEFVLDLPALQDWEDIATDHAGSLFVGDIGNNDARRRWLAVHQIDEPKIDEQNQARRIIKARRSWRLFFPDKPFDCESLFVWKETGYVISKVFDDEQARIYKFELSDKEAEQILKPVATLPVTSPVTAADISPNGRLLGLVAHNGAYVFRINGDPATAENARHNFVKFKDKHIEGCCFTPDGLLVVAETRDIYLFNGKAFRGGFTKP